MFNLILKFLPSGLRGKKHGREIKMGEGGKKGEGEEEEGWKERGREERAQMLITHSLVVSDPVPVPVLHIVLVHQRRTC